MTNHIIRARYDDQTIRVYQAYSPRIAEPALASGRFVSPFSMTRMTWIKPSFFWMMYRCGWGQKSDQEMVLGIDITREGFDWALRNAVLSAHVPAVHGSFTQWKEQLEARPVRIQWDPSRDWRLEVIPSDRSIQIGLGPDAVTRYVNEWTVRIEDVTPLAHSARLAAEAGKRAWTPADEERDYPMPPEAVLEIGRSETQ